MNCWVKFLPVCLLFSCLVPCFGGFSYSVILIAAPEQDAQIDARKINDDGDVVGNISRGDGRAPFLYHKGVLTDLIAGTSQAFGYGTAIDRNGNVGEDIGTPPHIEPATFINGKTHMLPTDGQSGYLIGGNLNGTLVGYIYDRDSNRQAAEWVNGKLNVLKNVPGSLSSAVAANEHGQIVGDYQGSDGKHHAFLWSACVTTSLQADSYSMTYVNDVNDSGDVIGIGTDPQGGFSNFAIIADRVVPIKPLPGGEKYGPDAAGGEAINDAGQIAGASQIANGDSRATLFEAGKTIDLNTQIDPRLGYLMDAAYDINNRGQILAEGIANGRSAAFILTPNAIPLPASAWMGIVTAPLLVTVLRKKSAVAA